MSAALLKLESVRVVFREPLAATAWLRGRFFGRPTVILDDVSLTMAPGEVVALLGANGAGKSTLVRVAAGLVEPRAGRVARPASQGLGLAEERSFYWRLSVRENLAFFAAAHPGGPGRVDETLAFVGLADRADLPVRACSTGMRARLGLARAIVGDPKLLLLDEVERGLDAGAHARLRALLTDWAARPGRAALVATHDLDHGACFTRAVCLDAGRVAEAGPFDAVAGALAARLAA